MNVCTDGCAIYQEHAWVEHQPCANQRNWFLLSINIKNRLKSKVSISVIGATSHTPIIPNSDGNVKIQISRMTKPRAEDIIADSFAFPIDVK